LTFLVLGGLSPRFVPSCQCPSEAKPSRTSTRLHFPWYPGVRLCPIKTFSGPDWGLSFHSLPELSVHERSATSPPFVTPSVRFSPPDIPPLCACESHNMCFFPPWSLFRPTLDSHPVVYFSSKTPPPSMTPPSPPQGQEFPPPPPRRRTVRRKCALTADPF